MSERFYTTIEVSGPNADAAAKSAMEAILKDDAEHQGDEGHWHGCWFDDSYNGPAYFDHASGQGAVIIIEKVSRHFPDATFHLYVDGSCGEGYQGPVRIQNGSVTDGRCDNISWGQDYDDPAFIELMKPFRSQPVPKDAVVVRMPSEMKSLLAACLMSSKRFERSNNTQN